MKADQSTPVSRRKLLATLAAGLASGGALTGPAIAGRGTTRPQGRTRRRPVALQHGLIEDWAEQVGTVFRVRGEAGTARLKLLEVRPLEALAGPRAGKRQRAFAAVFAPLSGVAPAGDRIYPVSGGGQALDLFFGPGEKTLVAIFA